MEISKINIKLITKNKVNFDSYELIVIGSGLFGLTIAQEFVRNLNLRVLVVDKRDHIGGNAWSEVDLDTGIEIHKYGSHLFHTSNQKVWEFVQKFTEFREYRHTVFANVKDEIHSLPINLTTLNSFFKRNFTPLEAARFFESASQITTDPKNFEEKVISKIGSELYEAFYLGYTKKQWGTDPKLLPIEMASRLPIRTTRNNRYFRDRYEGLPAESYGKFLTNMGTSQNIDFLLSTDYQEVKASIKPSTFIVYTGPIDQYFKYSNGRLGWRTLDFETTTLDMRDFQGTAVMNYPDIEVPFTRIHEYKHLGAEESFHVSKTIISKEFSRFSDVRDEPFYPINTATDRLIFETYRNRAQQEPNVLFGGRLGTYKYLDMDMAIASALVAFQNKILPRFLHV